MNTHLKDVGMTVRKSDKRFLSLVKATAQIVWITNQKGEMTPENHIWGAYTGQAAKEYVDYGWLDAVHPDERERVLLSWFTALQGQAVYESEFQIRNAAGAYRCFLVRGVPVVLTNGEVDEWVGTCTDITEQKRQQAQLQQAFERERHIVNSLQNALLLKAPKSFYVGLDVATVYEAALDNLSVGGDFYDTFYLQDSRIAFVVGDVSGKGLEAAAKTAEVKYAMRAMLYNNPSPAEALEQLNTFYLNTHDFSNRDVGTFVVITVAVVCPKTGKVVLSRAGAEPPLLVRAGANRQEAMGAGGMPVGVMPGETYEQQTCVLNTDDTLLLFTDGITEAKASGSKLKLFGYSGLRYVMRKCPLKVTMEELGRCIMEKLYQFTGGKLSDDVCMILIRKYPCQAENC